jgi:hypothetical protein
MGAIPFGSVTELRYGSDVVALFLPGDIYSTFDYVFFYIAFFFFPQE